MRQLGYVTLGDTQGGGTWLHSTARGDMSSPPTAEVHTVPTTIERYGLVTTGHSFQHGRSYQGERRRVDWHARLSMAALIGGTSLLFCAIVCAAALFFGLVVLPMVFGTR